MTRPAAASTRYKVQGREAVAGWRKATGMTAEAKDIGQVYRVTSAGRVVQACGDGLVSMRALESGVRRRATAASVSVATAFPRLARRCLGRAEGRVEMDST